MNSLNARAEQPIVETLLRRGEADHCHHDRREFTDQTAWSAIGVVRLDLELKIGGLNPVATHLIRHIPEISERHGRLHVCPRELDARFQELLSTIASATGLQSAAFAVARRDQICPLTLVLLPGARTGPTLLMSAPEAAPHLPADWLQAWFGLTQAESRIAAELAAGCTLEMAAASAGIRVSTVRTHLHRIFSKTGTSRQSELVKLLLSTPAGMAMISNISEQ